MRVPYAHQILRLFLRAVPQFDITPENITVNENDGNVEVCVKSSAPLGREVTAVAQTMMKNDPTIVLAEGTMAYNF